MGVADVTVMNIEGNFCGEPYGSQTASAPQELLTYLKSAGVDLIQMANSYSVQNGIIGLSASLNAIRSAGMEPLGPTPPPRTSTKPRAIPSVRSRASRWPSWPSPRAWEAWVCPRAAKTA